MKNLLLKLELGLLPVLSVLLILVAGCGFNDPAGPDETATPPDIPPASTFVMGFSDFTSSNMSAFAVRANGEVDQSAARQHWGWAGANIVVWNTLLTVTLVTPVAAFVESFQHQPVQQPDSSWVWSYNFRVLGVQHTAELHAKIISSGVRWDMFISKENGFTNLHWFFGESNLTGTEGTWTLNKADGTTPFLFIEWQRNPQNGTENIKYTNIIPDDPENGGFIFYGKTDETPFDAFYDIFNKGKDNHTRIEWNRETKEGRVQDSFHFGDSDWRCWDRNLEDADCP
ncbi:MAG: hypothetical protein ACE5IR_07010 [bacterium]